MSEGATVFTFPFFGILALIFITLKLAGIGVVANWSWWWVLSPLWIPTAITLVVLLGIFLAWFLIWLLM